MAIAPQPLALTWARRLRTEAERADLEPQLLVHRDGAVVAVLTADDPSALLQVAGTAGAAYGAQALTLVLEGVVPLVPRSPATGAEWEAGEAEAYWRANPGAAGRVVSEVLVVATGVRGGEASSASQMFDRTDEEGVDDGPGFEWVPPSAGGADEVGAALAARLQEEPVDPAEVRDPGDGFDQDPDAPFLPRERGRLVLDVGVTRILDRELGKAGGGARFVASDEEQSLAYLGEGLMSWQILVAG